MISDIRKGWRLNRHLKEIGYTWRERKESILGLYRSAWWARMEKRKRTKTTGGG